MSDESKIAKLQRDVSWIKWILGYLVVVTTGGALQTAMAAHP